MTGKLITQVKYFLRSEEGPTLVEYAVLIMLIILGLVTSIQVIGQHANASFTNTANIFTGS